MVKLLSWIILAPLALFIIVFSVSNRAPVTLELWPLPFAMEPPLFAVVLVGAVLGFLFGAAAAWISGASARSGARSRARAEAKRAKAAAREAANLRDKLTKLEEKNDTLLNSPTPNQALPAPDKAA